MRPNRLDTVPAPRSELIGRAHQVEAVLQAITHQPLVSVVGPAGVGKTRVVAAVSRAAVAHFPDGIFWVDLADVSGAVDEAATRALGLPESATDDPTRQVIEALGSGRALMVLDNCEHVVDDVANFADELLLSCPAIALLCTSQESLAIDGESLYALPPLDVPAADETNTASIRRCAAVQLLLARAARDRPDFVLDAGAALSAARICRRLDGLPLSIELAAARLRVLTLDQVAEALDDVLPLLVGTNRRAPTRHQSVRGALDWSHDLLTDGEQTALRRLSVFPGSFTLPAARAVIDAPSSGDAVDLLARLVDKSFLTVTQQHAQSRFRMLNIVRDYCRDRLDRCGEAGAVGDAHAGYFAAFATLQADRLGQAGEQEALDRLDDELANLDAAVRHALAGAVTQTGLQLGATLGRYCYLRGHYRQGRTWLEGLARWSEASSGDATPDVASPARAAVLHGAGRLAFLECDYIPATRLLEAALRLYRVIDDHQGMAASLVSLGSVAREQARYQRAEELYRQSLELCTDGADRSGAARARNYLAFLSWLRLDTTAATTLADQALVEFRAIGDHEGTCWALINLGCSQMYDGEQEAARTVFDEAAQITRAISFREGQAWTDHMRGLLALQTGDPSAESLLRAAFQTDRELGDRWRAASVLADLAATRVAEHPDSAAVLLGRADGLWEAIGSAPAPCERAAHDATRARAMGALGEAGYARSWQRGRASLWDQLDEPATPPPSVRMERQGLAEQSGSNGSGPAPEIRASVPSAPDAPAIPDVPSVPSVPPAPPAPATTARVTPTELSIFALGDARVEAAGRELVAADWRYAKPRELLFLLACCPPMTKDQIGARLWPELDHRQLRNALHTGLRDLRKAIGDPGWVLFAAGRYGLDTTRPLAFDVARFEQAIATARADPEPDSALAHLQRAIDAYRGDLLPTMSGEWVEERREGLRRAHVGAILQAGRLLAGRRRHTEAAEMFLLAVRADPLLEVANRELMVSWARAGEPARAVRHYRELEDRLRTELGVAPAAETRVIYQRLTASVRS